METKELTKKEVLNLYNSLNEHDKKACETLSKKLYDVGFREYLKKEPIAALKGVGIDTATIESKNIVVFDSDEKLPEAVSDNDIIFQLPPLHKKLKRKMNDDEFECVSGGVVTELVIIGGIASIVGIGGLTTLGVTAIGGLTIVGIGCLAYKTVSDCNVSQENRAVEEHKHEEEMARIKSSGSNG